MLTVRTLALLAGAAFFAASAQAGQVKYNAMGHTGQAHVDRSHTPGSFKTKAKVAYNYSRGFGIDRSKNVSDFQHPSTGIYCILPSVSVDTTQDYPLVSIEWDSSFGSALFAYWKDPNVFSDCPSGYQEVTTYEADDGIPVTLTDNVAFDFMIH
ncbi:MAG TPA: hypothetical protein VG843_00545 [Rhizomicrobium sp.]|jgi:hypothetical protein|nr:hypothetical protein [Rhizomicrobium sp.]